MFHKETLQEQEKRHEKERKKLLDDLEKERKREKDEKERKRNEKKKEETKKVDPWALPERGHW